MKQADVDRIAVILGKATTCRWITQEEALMLCKQLVEEVKPKKAKAVSPKKVT